MKNFGFGKCKKCGKEFQKNSNSQKYCSELCRWDGLIKASRKTVELECMVCGTKFMGRENGMYCSPKCAKVIYNQRQRERNKRYCIVCDKLLTEKRVKYCSNECRTQAIQMQSVNYYKKEKKKRTSSLIEIVVKAREEGLTYGQYVAKYQIK